MGQNSLTCPHCRRLVIAPGASAAGMPSCPVCGQPLVSEAQPYRAAASSPAPSAIPPIILTEKDRERASSPSSSQAAAARSNSTGPTPAIAAGERPNHGKKFGLFEVVKVVLGGAVGLGIGYLVVLWIQSRRPAEPAVAQSSATGSNKSRTSSGVQFPEFRPAPTVAQSPPTPAFTPPPLVGFGTTTSSTGPSDSSVGKTDQSPPASAPQADPAPATSLPPTPREPLEGLPEVLKLPSLVDTTSASLTSLHVPAGKTLDISFNAVAANIPAEAAYFVEAEEDTATRWLVCYTPSLSGSPDDKRVLAEMRHDQGQLKFAWRAPIEDADVRKELLNCLMRLTCENVSKTALLRAPSDAPRLLLDLTKDVLVHSLPPVDLPKEESVRLEIAALTGFPTGAALKDDKKVLKLRERAVIQFPHQGGAEIQVEFRRQPMMGDLQIVLRPEFRENAAEKVIMTLPRLADMKEAMEKSIPRDEAKIGQLGRELRSLNQQLKDLGPRPGGAAFAAWQAKYNSLSSAISSKNSQISRLSRRLPGLKARLAAVPAMQQFLSELHQKATLAVRVYAECGDAKIVFIDARLDPPAATPQAGG